MSEANKTQTGFVVDEEEYEGLRKATMVDDLVPLIDIPFVCVRCAFVNNLHKRKGWGVDMEPCVRCVSNPHNKYERITRFKMHGRLNPEWLRNRPQKKKHLWDMETQMIL